MTLKRLCLTQTSVGGKSRPNHETYTSLLEVKVPVCNASGAVHFMGSFLTVATSYISLSPVRRSNPKSEIFTALFSPRRMLRAARSR